jgi:hypothetical protein
MKNQLNYAFALLITGLLGLSACSEDEVSQSVVQIKFNTVNSASSIPSGRVAANSLTFTSGYIKLREIQFEAETDEADSIEVNIEQIVVIDFATGQTTPDLSGLTFPVGTYAEVEVELELQDENNVPSIVIEGTFIDRNDNSHPIRFEYNSGETFEVEKEGRITFAEGASVLAEVTFDPGVWFLDVSSARLEAATKDSEGVIVISSTSNPDIFETAADGLDLASEVEIKL